MMGWEVGIQAFAFSEKEKRGVGGGGSSVD